MLIELDRIEFLYTPPVRKHPSLWCTHAWDHLSSMVFNHIYNVPARRKLQSQRHVRPEIRLATDLDACGTRDSRPARSNYPTCGPHPTAVAMRCTPFVFLFLFWQRCCLPVRITSSLMSARVSERERGREPFNVRFSPLCLITSMNNEYFDFWGRFFFFSLLYH